MIGISKILKKICQDVVLSL